MRSISRIGKNSMSFFERDYIASQQITIETLRKQNAELALALEKANTEVKRLDGILTAQDLTGLTAAANIVRIMRTENAAMRAVVEAANKIAIWDDIRDWEPTDIFDLKEAIAALENTEGGADE